MTTEIKFPNEKRKIFEDKFIVIRPATEDDYWELSSEDLKVEYSPGVLYIHSPASFKHEEINIFLIRVFRKYFERIGNIKVFGSRSAIKLPNGKRPEPDVVFLYKEQITESMTVFNGVPPFLIEIISSSTKEYEYSTKLQWYKDANIPEFWFINPEDQVVEIYLLKNGSYVMTEVQDGTISPSSFQDVKLEVNWLWQFPKPDIDDLKI